MSAFFWGDPSCWGTGPLRAIDLPQFSEMKTRRVTLSGWLEEQGAYDPTDWCKARCRKRRGGAKPWGRGKGSQWFGQFEARTDGGEKALKWVEERPTGDRHTGSNGVIGFLECPAGFGCPDCLVP